ncbi:MAG TPA: serine/threonine-protein kinase [Kofleriaceae bacterium]|nr:serine/threonine-protein kinase [Kofleriaceae bacterium]
MSEDASRRGSGDATVTAAGSVGGAEVPRAQDSPVGPLRVRDRGRYEVRGEQGRGGLGLVSRAHDRELGRVVAVKELLVRGSLAELRFLREALITSRLEHPGIVPVHEAGRWSDGTPFYTMKLVGGRSLQALLATAVSLQERLAYVPNLIAVADAIAYAHDRGVVHRDLKPANVMIGDFGETIVIDWGLAKVIEDSDQQLDEEGPYRSSAHTDLTAAGSVLGTPAYMAPEQLGGRADHRADIYALGGILHQLLTGCPPHARGSEADVQPVLDYPRKAPADLIAVARRALARRREERYQTTRAFVDDLKAYMRRDRVAARKYSLPARLALAFARHRAVAMVVMAALVVLTVTLAISLVNIRAERAQAVNARETAVVNSAAAMMQRDPTRAWKALQAIPSSSAPALLRARIHAAGVAERTIPLPGRFDDKHVLKGGTRVVLSTGERTLHVLDTRTGDLRRLAAGLTEPVVWAATDDHVYFVHGSARLAVAVVPIDGGLVTEISTLETLPRYMFANEHGAYWLAPDGALYLGAKGRGAKVLARDVQAFMTAGSEIVICTKRQELVAGPSVDSLRELGSCDPEGAWGNADNGYAYASSKTLYVSLTGQLRSWPLSNDTEMRYLQLTSSGLVTAISRTGEALLRRPGAETIERVRLAGKADGVAAHGNLAAWAFADGSVQILNALDGRHWALQTTPGTIWCLTFLSEGRLMTCDRSEVRIWALPPSAPQLVASKPSASNNAALDATYGVLFDGVDGRVYVLAHGERHARIVHQHEGLSYGVAWCGAEACSAGWDGRVLCTDLKTNTVRTAVDAHSVTPWLSSGGGQCFTAAANGGVIDLRTPEQPAYSHGHEPYRLAVSHDGRYVASGDWGGDLILFDIARREIIATRTRAHVGRITNVAWTDGLLVTSGADGVLRLWSTALEERRSWRMSRAIRYLDVAKQAIGATLDDGSAWLLSTRGRAAQHVELGAVVSAAAVSPNGAFFAVGTTDGDVVVLADDGGAAATRFGHGLISCLEFEDAKTFLVCTSSGRVMRVPLSALPFQRDAQ